MAGLISTLWGVKLDEMFAKMMFVHTSGNDDAYFDAKLALLMMMLMMIG